MATDNDLELLISADASGVKDGMDLAKDAVKDGAGAMGSAFQTLAAGMIGAGTGVNSTFEKMSSAGKAFAAQMDGVTGSVKGGFAAMSDTLGTVYKPLAALAALTAGVGIFKEAISETRQFTSEAVQLSKAFGIAVDEAATLNVALGDVFSSADAAGGAAAKLAKQMRTNEASVKAMGLETRDANGNFRNMGDLMQDAIKVLRGYKEGTDRALAGQTLFGRGADDINALLKLTPEVIEAARKKQEELGLTVGTDNVAANKKYKDAMNDVGDVMLALKKVLGDAVLPVFTKLGEWFAMTGPLAVGVVRGAIGLLAASFWVLKGAVTIVWETINAMVVSIAEPLRALSFAISKAIAGDFTGAAKELSSVSVNVSKAWATAFKEIRAGGSETAERLAAIMGRAATGKLQRPEEGKVYKAPAEKGAFTKQAEAELSEAKVIFQERQRLEGSYREYSRAQELAFWEQKLRVVTKGSEDEKLIRKKVGDLKLAIDKELFLAEVETEKAKYAEYDKNAAKRVELETLLLEKMKTAYGADSKEYQTQLRAKTQADLAYAAQKRAMTEEVYNANEKKRLAGLDEELAAMKHKAAMTLATNEETIALEEQLEVRRYAIKRQALEARAQLVDATKDPQAAQRIKGQLEELEGEHQRAMTALQRRGDAERSMSIMGVARTIQSGFTQVFAQLMKGQLTAANAMREIMKTIAGAVIQMLAEIAARMLINAALQAVWGKSLATSNIAAKSAEAGAGGVASMAAAPFPLNTGAPAFGAAMAAAAASFGAMAAAPGFAAGAWNLPSDGITKVHRGEAILNATDAAKFRAAASAVERTEPASGQINLHISALDGASVRKVFEQNGEALVSAVRKQARQMRGAL